MTERKFEHRIITNSLAPHVSNLLKAASQWKEGDTLDVSLAFTTMLGAMMHVMIVLAEEIPEEPYEAFLAIVTTAVQHMLRVADADDPRAELQASIRALADGLPPLTAEIAPGTVKH